MRQNRGDPSTTIKHYYVPEEIIDHIPSYKSQSQLLYDNVGDERVIQDRTPRDQQAVTSAIRFLTGGYLTPVNLSPSLCEKSLQGLVQLYNFSVALKIVKLEAAVVNHIDLLNFEAMAVNVFLGFARTYYNGGGADTQHSSLGCFIKKKLVLLLPRLQQFMTAEKISSEEGVLGKQLIAVLFEDRAQNQVALGSIKRER
jgi:hypothetical protein